MDTLKCFKVFDDETHYIAARSMDEARTMYLNEVVGGEEMPSDVRISEMSREDACKVKVRTTLADLLDDADKPCVLAGTIE